MSKTAGQSGDHTDGINNYANSVITGDCVEELQRLPSESVHAVVTDPPYGIAFMGESWDDFEPGEYQRFCEEWAREALRVLKPGGHLLSFSGTRTVHRLACGIEDAGFTVRDRIAWLYGQGFPKAMDVADAIRDGLEPDPDQSTLPGAPDMENALAGPWEGWRTGLKPGHEPVVVAQKPRGDLTVAECAVKHGTGALNIDATRVPSEERPTFDRTHEGEAYGSEALSGSERSGTTNEGRYPANVVIDQGAARQLDAQSGDLDPGARPGKRETSHFDSSTGQDRSELGPREEIDGGGASRFYYVSKASPSERTLDGAITNDHPTVKPVDLMEWLVQLVTAPGQVVVDPFCGSGTTLMACKETGREWVGVEKNPEWADVARVRAGLSPEDPAVVRADEEQRGLDAFNGGG